ncbi:MAG: hypothetical protein V4594_14985 [Bacteroidota bacterium]
MKPIHKLKLKDKIKYLHALFPAAIPEYLTFIRTYAIEVIDDREEITRVWGNQVVSLDYWLILAQLAETRTKRYGDSLSFCGKLFYKSLFGGKLSLFSIHCLLEYIEQDDCSDKFKTAVKLFFDHN